MTQQEPALSPAFPAQGQTLLPRHSLWSDSLVPVSQAGTRKGIIPCPVGQARSRLHPEALAESLILMAQNGPLRAWLPVSCVTLGKQLDPSVSVILLEKKNNAHLLYFVS